MRQALRGAVCFALAMTAAPRGVAQSTPAKPANVQAKKAVAAPAATAKASKRPPAVTSLEVAVSDPAGKPVEGALVMATPSEGAYSLWGRLLTEKTRSSVTGREGKARLESLPPGPWGVTVRARGFAPVAQHRVAAGPLAVRLEKGGAITGVVREGEGLRPLAGARVGVVDVGLLGDWQEEAARNEARTDAQGRFRLEGIGRTPVRLLARAAGFARAERANVRAGASVELFLFPGSMLSGLVKDDAGRPVKGATVSVEGDRPWEAPPPERSDARGEFQSIGVAPGEYTVVAREGGRAPGIATVVVEPDVEASVTLTVSDGGYATGRIVDPAGGPLAGKARVERLEGHGLPEFASDLLAAEAKADGRFTLGPLPLGALGIEASAPGHAERRVDAEVTARGATLDLGDVTLEDGLSLRGRVRDREGNGIADARIHAETEQGEKSEGDASAETDGSFVIGGLKAGRHRVSAKAVGYAEAKANADAGGPPLDLVLDAGGEIAGRVVDDAGKPADDARVRAEQVGVERPRSRSYGARADEGDGSFVLRDVTPGAYSLEAHADGRGEASLSDVRVTAGRSVNVGTLTLARGGVLVGSVVDSEGQGIPGATVSAERDVTRRIGQLTTQSGSAGTFEIRGAPVGPLNVSARHPSYAEGPAVVAEVDPEKEPVPVRLVLGRGGRIEGRALHRDGRPFAGGRVTFYSLDPGGAGMRIETTAIAPDGSFVVDHVAPGRTSLNLMAFTPSSPMMSGGIGNILTGIASREVQVREGETVVADIPLRDVVVAARVAKGGQAAAGVRVDVRMIQGSSVMMWAGPVAAAAGGAAGGPPLLGCTSREDGSCELLVFEPGPVLVQWQDAGQRYPGRREEIPDAERFELDIEIAAATVSGIVVEKNGGAPVAEAGVSLRRTDGGKGVGGGASSGPDGRFSVAVDPGEYTLQARAPGHQQRSMPLSVGQAGLSGVRVELDAGLEITGRLVDTAGRPAGRLPILATAPDGDSTGYADSLPDGTFRIGGLGSRPYAIVAGSELAGLAFVSGVLPGGEPITLPLRLVGRIAVQVVDASGAPVKDAYPSVDAIDGVKVRLPGIVSGPTDANGVYTLKSPAGTVDVTVHSGETTARGQVAVTAGQTASLTIALPASPAP